jgi:hypothetical protein
MKTEDENPIVDGLGADVNVIMDEEANEIYLKVSQ